MTCFSPSVFALFVLNHPRLAHVGYKGADRSLLMGHNALLTDSYGSFICIITDMITHGRAFVEPVSNTGWSKLVTCSYSCGCVIIDTRSACEYEIQLDCT